MSGWWVLEWVTEGVLCACGAYNAGVRAVDGRAAQASRRSLRNSGKEIESRSFFL